ncbi:Uncharacterised protein [uncultured Clostridium sp.]|uniref:hypothetical protein n=1 Tax=uncultured Clostridium sp. TaxID=59620 RepID=UPI000822A45C|nr:hypothetical protein [uncultured Clostridium sp.]SCK03385.1 Uncharacterised protein [uncultured Clostridium sp.]
MKNLLKKIALTLTLIMSITSIPTFASINTYDNSENLVYYEDTIEGIKFIEEELVGTTIPSPRSYGLTSKLLDTFTTYKNVYVTPTGQPSLGYRGGSGATVFFFESGGSSTTFTATIDFKNVTLTAETGRTASSGSGYAASVPSTSGNHKFQFIKYYTIKTQKIAIYKYGTYQYTTYSHSPSYSLGHRWIKL